MEEINSSIKENLFKNHISDDDENIGFYGYIEKYQYKF